MVPTGPARLGALLLALAAMGAVARVASAQTGGAASQTPQATTPREAAPPPEALTAADEEVLARIRKAVQSGSPIRVDASHLAASVRFYTTVHAEGVTFSELNAKFHILDFQGKVPRAGVTHQDFLNYVAPKFEAHVTVADVLKAALIQGGVELAKIVAKQIIEGIGGGPDAKRLAIRAQIDKELAALTGKPIK
jgi:hypothetical protein